MLRVHCSLMKQLHFQGEFGQTTVLLRLAGGTNMPGFVLLQNCPFARKKTMFRHCVDVISRAAHWQSTRYFLTKL